MKILLFFLFMSFTSTCLSQRKSNKSISQDSSIKKWANSVINLECSNELYSVPEISKELNLREYNAAKAGIDYSTAQRKKDFDSMSLITKIVTGTALYIYDGNKRYLITAKHVVYDKHFTDRHIATTRDKSYHTREFFEKMNSPIIIKTPYQLYLKGKKNISIATPETNYDSASRNFQFSNDELDLAILSLQSKSLQVLRETLDEDGYLPLNINEIDSSNFIKTGSEIYTIGYPGNTIVARDGKTDIVLPLVTFGRVGMYHDRLPYFTGDITVYPGNSGGPVICDDQMIGIVHGQIVIPVNDAAGDRVLGLYSRGSLAKIIRSSLIFPLLRKLQSIETNPKFK